MSHERDNKKRIVLLSLTLVFSAMLLVLWSWQPSAIAQNEPQEAALQANSVQSISPISDDDEVIIPSPMPLATEKDSIAAVEAIAIQLRPGIEGIALIDKENQTICIYQYQTHRPNQESLVLLAARSFRYDVLLEDYNTADPKPGELKERILKARKK